METITASAAVQPGMRSITAPHVRPAPVGSLLVVALSAGLALAGPAVSTAATGGSDVPPPTVADDHEVASRGLSPGGAELAAGVDWTARPHYAIAARIDPAAGEVDATLSARLPVGTDAESAVLRWFPAAVADHAAVTSVRVDGVDVDPDVEGTILTVALPDGHPAVVTVDVAFGFTAVAMPAGSTDAMPGSALDPAAIGLLSRTDEALTLGHWFPIWIPDGLDQDPDLDGYGDISNFPAARIEATLDDRLGGAVRVSLSPLGADGAMLGAAACALVGEIGAAIRFAAPHGHAAT